MLLENLTGNSAADTRGQITLMTPQTSSAQEFYSSASVQYLLPLGDLPGGIFSSRARAISADGSTVVGMSYSAEDC